MNVLFGTLFSGRAGEAGLDLLSQGPLRPSPHQRPQNRSDHLGVAGRPVGQMGG